MNDKKKIMILQIALKAFIRYHSLINYSSSSSPPSSSSTSSSSSFSSTSSTPSPSSSSSSSSGIPSLSSSSSSSSLIPSPSESSKSISSAMTVRSTIVRDRSKKPNSIEMHLVIFLQYLLCFLLLIQEHSH